MQIGSGHTETSYPCSDHFMKDCFVETSLMVAKFEIKRKERSDLRLCRIFREKGCAGSSPFFKEESCQLQIMFPSRGLSSGLSDESPFARVDRRDCLFPPARTDKA